MFLAISSTLVCSESDRSVPFCVKSRVHGQLRARSNAFNATRIRLFQLLLKSCLLLSEATRWPNFATSNRQSICATSVPTGCLEVTVAFASLSNLEIPLIQRRAKQPTESNFFANYAFFFINYDN